MNLTSLPEQTQRTEKPCICFKVILLFFLSQLMNIKYNDSPFPVQSWRKILPLIGNYAGTVCQRSKLFRRKTVDWHVICRLANKTDALDRWPANPKHRLVACQPEASIFDILGMRWNNQPSFSGKKIQTEGRDEEDTQIHFQRVIGDDWEGLFLLFFVIFLG